MCTLILVYRGDIADAFIEYQVASQVYCVGVVHVVPGDLASEEAFSRLRGSWPIRQEGKEDISQGAGLDRVDMGKLRVVGLARSFPDKHIRESVERLRRWAREQAGGK